LKEFVLNNRFSLFALAVGIFIGAVVYFSKPITYKFRVVYEYQVDNTKNLPKSIASDTFFIFREIPIRNYIASYADTMINQGTKRSELILYLSEPLSDSSIDKTILQTIGQHQVKFVDAKINERKRYSKALIVYPILGLFLSLILRYFSPHLRLKRK
jgi:hypothetical protein